MEASEEVCEEAEVVHSDRMVVLCAMHELQSVVSKTGPLVAAMEQTGFKMGSSTY